MQILNSDVKIRSHQRLITPPKGGSFKQMTSTRSKMHANNESGQNANSHVKNQKPSATHHTTQGWELQATDIMHTNVTEFAKRGNVAQKRILHIHVT